MLSIVLVFYMTNTKLYNNIYNRMEKTFDTLVHFNISGSEGSRANSSILMIKYYKDSELTKILVGEGYDHYSSWAKQKFSDRNSVNVSYARGHINNIIAIVGISTGILGLVIYYFLYYTLLYRKLIDKQDLIFIILVQLSFGFFISYYYWWIILIIIIKNKILEIHNNENLHIRYDLR